MLGKQRLHPVSAPRPAGVSDQHEDLIRHAVAEIWEGLQPDAEVEGPLDPEDRWSLCFENVVRPRSPYCPPWEGSDVKELHDDPVMGPLTGRYPAHADYSPEEKSNCDWITQVAVNELSKYG